MYKSIMQDIGTRQVPCLIHQDVLGKVSEQVVSLTKGNGKVVRQTGGE